MGPPIAGRWLGKRAIKPVLQQTLRSVRCQQPQAHYTSTMLSSVYGWQYVNGGTVFRTCTRARSVCLVLCLITPPTRLIFYETSAVRFWRQGKKSLEWDDAGYSRSCCRCAAWLCSSSSTTTQFRWANHYPAWSQPAILMQL